MKKFGILALAVTMFTGSAALAFAQGTDKSTDTTKKAKKKKNRKKSTAAKAT